MKNVFLEMQVHVRPVKVHVHCSLDKFNVKPYIQAHTHTHTHTYTYTHTSISDEGKIGPNSFQDKLVVS